MPARTSSSVSTSAKVSGSSRTRASTSTGGRSFRTSSMLRFYLYYTIIASQHARSTDVTTPTPILRGEGVGNIWLGNATGYVAPFTMNFWPAFYDSSMTTITSSDTLGNWMFAESIESVENRVGVFLAENTDKFTWVQSRRAFTSKERFGSVALDGTQKMRPYQDWNDVTVLIEYVQVTGATNSTQWMTPALVARSSASSRYLLSPFAFIFLLLMILQ